jgi:hypothetical protein
VRRALALGAGLVVAAVLASQLFLAGLVSGRIEDRLTEGGGSATVSIDSFPALRLLFADGSRMQVRGSGLNLDLAAESSDVFGRLDGFSTVDVAMSDLRVGAIDVRAFTLRRQDSDPYRMRALASTLGGAVPIRIDMELLSDDGEVEVVSGGSTVAGVPTGPLGEILAEAVLAQL